MRRAAWPCSISCQCTTQIACAGDAISPGVPSSSARYVLQRQRRCARASLRGPGGPGLPAAGVDRLGGDCPHARLSGNRPLPWSMLIGGRRAAGREPENSGAVTQTRRYDAIMSLPHLAQRRSSLGRMHPTPNEKVPTLRGRKPGPEPAFPGQHPPLRQDVTSVGLDTHCTNAARCGCGFLIGGVIPLGQQGKVETSRA